MNYNTFNWNRFCKVVKKDARSIWQSMGTPIIIITLLPFALWLLWLVMGSVFGMGELPAIVPELRLLMILGCVSLVALMTPSRMYRTCNRQNEGMYFAMLPASKLEKYLSMVLFSFIVCPLICLLGSLVLDILLRLLPFGHYHQFFWQCTYLDVFWSPEFVNAEDMGAEGYTVFNMLFSPCRMAFWFLLSYVYQVSIFFFTNTIFKKHKVLLTFLSVWAIEFVLQLIMIPILGIVAINGSWVEAIFESSDPVSVMSTTLWIGVGITLALTALFFWWTARRLKKMSY